MEAKLFGIQALDEPIDTFKRGLVGDGARQFPISLCSVVDFNTAVTHDGTSRSSGGAPKVPSSPVDAGSRAVMKINLPAGNPFGNGETESGLSSRLLLLLVRSR
jgi:hypothetical protein